MKIQAIQKVFVKFSNTKLRENPFICSRDFPLRTDERTDWANLTSTALEYKRAYRRTYDYRLTWTQEFSIKLIEDK
jgi:hypothetical protein